MKHFIKLAFVSIFAVIMVGCARAPSNAHVLSTGDCGSTWEKVATSSAVSKHTGNVCGYNLALPNWPMPGEAEFKTQFANKVSSRVKMSYSYIIVDPIKFIKHASYLGKMNTNNLEISADSVGHKYEMAENMIIDVALREITTDITRKIAIEDAVPADVEDAISKKIVAYQAERGIAFSDLAMIMEPDEQTRLAIDVTTAMRVYQSAGLGEEGKAIIAARAGATKITVTSDKGPAR